MGSLKEKYSPLHLVIPDQFVDRTTKQESTFFGRELVAHVAFAHPFCPNLTRVMAEACREAGATFHVGGTYVCIEGPQFSTRAESELYRTWGMDIVGMTNLQEAKLPREAQPSGQLRPYKSATMRPTTPTNAPTVFSTDSTVASLFSASCAAD